jgi:hypothetical protein
MTRRAEREAWTAHITGEKPQKANKYRTAPKEERGGYASKHEMEVAAGLHALQRGGEITDLCEQCPIVLVPGNGKIRPITYVADFVYRDKQGNQHFIDAKGYRTPIYRLKKKLAALLLQIEIEEA